jgi:hypothetical protein
MPPMMVTKESAFATLSIRGHNWDKKDFLVSCFLVHWEGRDCFFFAPAEGPPYPMTPKTLMEHSHLVITVSDRVEVKNRYFDEDGKILLEAFEAHLDVEHVHAL